MLCANTSKGAMLLAFLASRNYHRPQRNCISRDLSVYEALACQSPGQVCSSKCSWILWTTSALGALSRKTTLLLVLETQIKGAFEKAKTLTRDGQTK